MRFRSTLLFSAVVLFAISSCLASPRTRRGPTSQHFTSRKSSSSVHTKPVAQRAIDSDRTTQIQTALISHGYMTGSPSGSWTPETEEALRKLQADNGWQTKMVPDSRAIIKLGLGPGSPSPESTAATTNLPSGPSSIDPELTLSSQN